MPATVLALSSAAHAGPVSFEILLHETNPGMSPYFGRFTVDEADLRAGGGALQSFELDIDKDWWELGTDEADADRFSVKADGTIGLEVSITDTAVPGGYGARLHLYAGGRWSVGEMSGDYTVRRAVARPGPRR